MTVRFRENDLEIDKGWAKLTCNKFTGRGIEKVLGWRDIFPSTARSDSSKHRYIYLLVNTIV